LDYYIWVSKTWMSRTPCEWAANVVNNSPFGFQTRAVLSLQNRIVNRCAKCILKLSLTLNQKTTMIDHLSRQLSNKKHILTLFFFFFLHMRNTIEKLSKTSHMFTRMSGDGVTTSGAAMFRQRPNFDCRIGRAGQQRIATVVASHTTNISLWSVTRGGESARININQVACYLMSFVNVGWFQWK
jgi:hypothetical protein